eukprot:gene2571-48802_t
MAVAPIVELDPKAVTIYTFVGSHYSRKLMGAFKYRDIKYNVVYLPQRKCRKWLPYPHTVPVVRMPGGDI